MQNTPPTKKGQTKNGKIVQMQPQKMKLELGVGKIFQKNFLRENFEFLSNSSLKVRTKIQVMVYLQSITDCPRLLETYKSTPKIMQKSQITTNFKRSTRNFGSQLYVNHSYQTKNSEDSII
jgi:hypothetical protein